MLYLYTNFLIMSSVVSLIKVTSEVVWLEHTKRQVQVFFLSRNAFTFPYVEFQDQVRY